MNYIKKIITIFSLIILFIFTESCDQEYFEFENKISQAKTYTKCDDINEYNVYGDLHNKCLDILENDTKFPYIFNNKESVFNLFEKEFNIILDYSINSIFIKSVKEYANNLNDKNLISSKEYNYYLYIDSITKIDYDNIELFIIDINNYLYDLDGVNNKEKHIIYCTSSILKSSAHYWYKAFSSNSKWNKFFNTTLNDKAPSLFASVAFAAVQDAFNYNDCMNTYITEDPTLLDCIRDPSNNHTGRLRSLNNICSYYAGWASANYIANNGFK